MVANGLFCSNGEKRGMKDCGSAKWQLADGAFFPYVQDGWVWAAVVWYNLMRRKAENADENGRRLK